MATRTPAKEGLHFFTILAYEKQRRGADVRRRRRRGAYVSCWINFRLYEGAFVLAKFYIRKNGWQIRSLEEHRWINGPADVTRGSIRYFREAQRDGASFVFHGYSTVQRKRRAKAKN